jgi:hypothetical protein
MNNSTALEELKVPIEDLTVAIAVLLATRSGLKFWGILLNDFGPYTT